MNNYSVKGVLPKGFMGGITYSTLITEDFNQLQLKLAFDKREVEHVTEELEARTMQAWEANFDSAIDQERITQSIGKMKAEINVSLFINDQFIGSAHRDDIHKHIIITKEGASLGFSPYDGRKGTLKIVLNVISIVNDETNYHLEVLTGD